MNCLVLHNKWFHISEYMRGIHMKQLIYSFIGCSKLLCMSRKRPPIIYSVLFLLQVQVSGLRPRCWSKPCRIRPSNCTMAQGGSSWSSPSQQSWLDGTALMGQFARSSPPARVSHQCSEGNSCSWLESSSPQSNSCLSPKSILVWSRAQGKPS